ncbi:MAG: pimeloyl-ACP methyl ester carboxylesterase [Granulosicoccus sp.]
MEDEVIKTASAEWQVLSTGYAGDTWIVLHGFGQHAVLMLRFMEIVKPNDRVISINLPFHGNTKMIEPNLNVNDLDDLIGRILRNENVERCSLLGYSLGGKVALKLAELSPGKVERMVLIAPDGLKLNRFYLFATRTKLGNFLFRRAMKDPSRLLSICSIAVKLNLMDERILTFYQNQLSKPETREMIYGSWQAFKNINPNLIQIRKNIFRYKIKTELFFGKHDRVIHPRLAKQLSGVNGKTSTVHFLDRGHDLTSSEAAQKIKNLL